jgi:hypothetical protein
MNRFGERIQCGVKIGGASQITEIKKEPYLVPDGSYSMLGKHVQIDLLLMIQTKQAQSKRSKEIDRCLGIGVYTGADTCQQSNPSTGGLRGIGWI